MVLALFIVLSIVISVNPVYAMKNEKSDVASKPRYVVIHDVQLKMFLAQKGINFDADWQESGYNADRMIQKIQNIFSHQDDLTPSLQPSLFVTADLPQDKAELISLIQNRLKIPALPQGPDYQAGNKRNRRVFCAFVRSGRELDQNYVSQHDVLRGKNFSDANIIALGDIYESIGKALCLYVEKAIKNQKTLHFYIMITLKDEGGLTVSACPGKKQDNFIRMYTQEDIKKLQKQWVGCYLS